MSADFASKSSRRPEPKNWVEAAGSWTTVTHSPEETREAGRQLAMRLQPPCVILLEGELGAGKTTLAKGIVGGLGAAREEDVTSPTFALVHEYGGAAKIYHIDLYRIECISELSTLGLDDILSGNGVVIVEWGEKLGTRLAGRALRVRLEYAGNDDRKITVENHREPA